MTIYQLVDEQNHLVCEYMRLEKAIEGAEQMASWDSEHNYHVQELEIEVV